MLKDRTNLKIFILCAYYNRPLLVRNTLNSVLKANEYHKNWHFGFLDDGSKVPGRPIVEEILKDHMDQVTIVETNAKFEDKVMRGLTMGALANKAISESDADIGIMLCDDDELVPDYLKNLSDFFLLNDKVLYCYSKIYIFNPLLQKSDGVVNLADKYNQHTTPINPVGKVDASQVAWRIDCCKKYGAWFGESTKCVDGKPWAKDTDRCLFENLFNKCGMCYPTGFVGQYKGVHDYQLLWHKNVSAASLKVYDDMYKELGGVVF